jgi:hypothetical protein
VDIERTKAAIDALLPNRGAVLAYVWDELPGPLPEALDAHLIALVGDYGSWKERHRADGRLAHKGWIYRGKKQGRWIHLYRNGKPHKDCHFRNGQCHGRCTIWRVDGAYQVADYRKGKKHGECLGYSGEGTLRYKSVYEKGRLKEYLGPAQLAEIRS